MKKRILSFILALCIVQSLFSQLATVAYSSTVAKNGDFIKITNAPAQMKVGESIQLETDYSFTDSNVNIYWDFGSDDGWECAELSETGYLTIEKVPVSGILTVTVTNFNNMEISDYIDITIKSDTPTVRNVTISPDKANVQVGKTIKLTGTIDNQQQGEFLKWSIKDEDVSCASVDENGLVSITAIPWDKQVTVYAQAYIGTEYQNAYGEATITAIEDPDAPLTGFKIGALKDGGLILSKGEIKTPWLIFTPSNIKDKSVEWTSSDESKVLISSDGEISALDYTDTPVTVTATPTANPSLAVTITVTVPRPYNWKVSISPKTIKAGTDVTVTIAIPDDKLNEITINEGAMAKTMYYCSELFGDDYVYSDSGTKDKTKLRTLTFKVPDNTADGTYTLTNGIVFVDNPFASHFENLMPNITFTVGAVEPPNDNVNENDSGIPSYSIDNIIGIPEDFSNDLWTQYDFKELSVGDTSKIYPRRIPQIVGDSINNDVFRPNFNFEILAGDSISLSDTQSNQYITVSAVKNGISVIKITYDAAEYQGISYGKSSLVNTAYVVFDVNDNPANLTITTNIEETSYDTIYFTHGDTVDYSFTANANGAESIEVTLNGEIITSRGSSYSVKLQNGANIIGIHANLNGKRKSLYKIIDAHKISITISNGTNPNQPLKIGDRAEISFKGITNPVPKLATIYNPTWHSTGQWATEGTFVEYTDKNNTVVKGYCTQWDLDTKNTISINLTESGEYSFTGGRIFSQWWGDELGSDKTTIGNKPNLDASTHEKYFSALPDFSFNVTNEIGTNIPVTGITLNKNSHTLLEGEQLQLNPIIAPNNATNKNIIWSTSNSYFASVDKNGLVTAKKANTQQVPTVTITAKTEDGSFTASCTITVIGSPNSITGLTINRSYATMSKGSSMRLIARVLPNNTSNQKLIWSSSNDSYASVSKTGLVMAKKQTTEREPEIIITVSTQDGKYSADCAITILNNDNTDFAKAEIIIRQIDALGTITLQSEQEISAVKNAYYSLTKAQRALVDNADILFRAENTLFQLKAQQKFQQVLQQNTFPIYSENINSEDNSTGNNQQLSFVNMEIPVAADNYTVALIMDIEKNSKLLSSDANSFSLSDQFTVANLYKKYQLLPEEQKLLLINFDKLENAMNTIAKHNQSDITSGVSVTGLDWNIKLNCKPVTTSYQGIENLTKLQQQIGDLTLLSMWNISLMELENENEYIPQKPVTLTLRADELPIYDGYTVIHCNDDGSIEYLDAEIKNGTISLEVESFSSYAIAGYNGSSPLEMAISNVSPDKNYFPLILIGAGILVLAGLFVIKYKSDKKTLKEE